MSLNKMLKNETHETKIRLKYEIAYYLSQIMFTIHNLNGVKAHGHLTSHNVFLDIKKVSSKHFTIKVRIADIENFDFMQYSNMFFDYRITSVWSSPEALATLKKIKEPTGAMDIYSYGLIIWELWHQAIPFDNDTPSAAKYVINEHSRPKIIHNRQEYLDQTNDREEDEPSILAVRKTQDENSYEQIK